MNEKNNKNATKNNNKPNKKNKKTFQYKHVKVNHVRPKLSKGNFTNSNRSKDKDKKVSVQRDKNSKLRIIPLGGLDTIGNNMTVFESKTDMILDDAGLMFPDEGHPGIDLVLPDYTYVLENANKLKAIFITHGHEDHIGCLPYLIKDLDKNIPIYGTKLSIGLIKSKFQEFDINNISFNEIKSGDVVKVGSFQVSFFSVNHSIPGAVGMFIQTPAGNVLHTGDFKIDLTPVGKCHTDFSLISKFAKTGIDLLMSDSTNALNKAPTPSESEVGPVLEDIISKSDNKVVIATFASHIHRIQQVCNAAKKCNRKVVLAGKSMIQNVEIARGLGYLFVDDDDIIDAYELNSRPSDSAVILCTGSQGEPLSALARIANGSHKTIEVNKGDTVIISATPVPGNEKAVSSVINKLSKLGVNVYDKTISQVHVSGHASADELKLMISLCNPDAFVPMHGETRHLIAHAKLAKSAGVNPKNIYICDNGDVLDLSTSGIERKESVPSGIVFVDGLSVGETSDDTLNDRNFLAEGGIAIVSMAIDINVRKIKGPIMLSMRGVSGGDDADLINDLRNIVASTMNKELKRSGDIPHLKKVCKDTMIRHLKDKIKQRPMTSINLIEI